MNFNIYYLNLPKAYEISMIIDNTITTTIERETGNREEKSGSVSAGASVTIPGGNSGSLGAGLGNKKINSTALREIIEVKTTKSVYLTKVIQKCTPVNKLKGLKEGDLIQINNCELSLHNEDEIRQLKVLNNGLMKGVTVDEYDVNNLIDSILKDYSYLLRGKIAEKELVIKIPMNMDNEFENEYNIDDILIGNVSVIGIYKGEVKLGAIKNTFNYITNQGQNNEDDVFVMSNQGMKSSKPTEIEEDNLHFIDVIAIVQEINFGEEVEEVEEITKKDNKFRNWLRKMNPIQFFYNNN